MASIFISPGGKAIRPKDAFMILKACLGKVEVDLGRHRAT